MRQGRGRGWGAAVALIGAAVATGALLVPLHAAATDSDLKHAYVFRLGAAHGYSILAYAGSERADGRGEILLIVGGPAGGVLYAAPASVTATRIDADLGALGSVSLDVLPSGEFERLKPRCDPEARALRVEPHLFRGSFEFRGEEGYTHASSPSLREYARFLFDFGCAGYSSGETSGADLPGARLRLHSGHDRHRLALQANKNRPSARSHFEVEAHEERGGIAITRSRTLWAGASAFQYDPDLQTATLEPPAPFSGRARFRRARTGKGVWSGDLSIDMPGRSNLPLSGRGVGVTLAPSCWHERKGRFRC